MGDYNNKQLNIVDENTKQINIIGKLDKTDENKEDFWIDWTDENKKELLEIYYKISKKEKFIFKLIYSLHSCDSWEDIFRDYDENYLYEKTVGVEIALESLNKI
jgi:hypothetical protein